VWADGSAEPMAFQSSEDGFYSTGRERGSTTTTNRIQFVLFPSNFDDDTGRMEIDDIRAFQPAAIGMRVTESYVGDGSTTTLDLYQDYIQVEEVTVDGVATPVTESSPSITFDRAPSSGSVIEVEYIAA